MTVCFIPPLPQTHPHRTDDYPADGANADLPGPKHMLWPSVHQPKILELILDKGANLRKAPGVLELAASINSLEAVTILLRHNVDVNAKKDGIFTREQRPGSLCQLSCNRRG